MRSVALLAILLLAGCTANPNAGTQENGATDATSCTRVVLVDEQVHPIANASLTVEETGKTGSTDASGSFCADKLLPKGASTLHVYADGRHWMMGCHHDDGEPEGCHA